MDNNTWNSTHIATVGLVSVLRSALKPCWDLSLLDNALPSTYILNCSIHALSDYQAFASEEPVAYTIAQELDVDYVFVSLHEWLSACISFGHRLPMK